STAKGPVHDVAWTGPFSVLGASEGSGLSGAALGGRAAVLDDVDAHEGDERILSAGGAGSMRTGVGARCSVVVRGVVASGVTVSRGRQICQHILTKYAPEEHASRGSLEVGAPGKLLRGS